MCMSHSPTRVLAEAMADETDQTDQALVSGKECVSVCRFIWATHIEGKADFRACV